MRIYLVRHGQSLANADKSVHGRMADHAIPLSELGHQQASKTAGFLQQHFETFHKVGRVRIWRSPYLRTRQTIAPIEAALKTSKIIGGVVDCREHLFLAEQQFGLFDGISHEGTKNEIQRRYPDEYAHYKKCEEFSGGFWARMPLGESKFDLCLRVHQAFGTFHRDHMKHSIKSLIIGGHGSTNRAFAMMWLHHPFEWFENEPNPKNGSVRLIEDNKDKGYIFEP